MNTLRFIILSAFLLSLSIVVARPENDTCEKATSINRLPFEANVNRRRTLRSASQDEFAVACNPPLIDNVVDEEEDSKFAVYRTLSNGVWYKIDGAREGTELSVSIEGIGDNVDSQVIMSDGNEDDSGCALMFFTCIPDMTEASSISGDSNISSQSYQWIVEEGAIYYIYISLVRGEAGSNRGYNLKVEMLDYTPPVVVATAKSISAHDIDPLSLLRESSSDSNSIGDSLMMKSEAYKNLSKVRVCTVTYVATYDLFHNLWPFNFSI